MISVIIPLYNKEKQIAKTLQTVLSQTYQNFEIIVVNDGSTDNSVDELKNIEDRRIKLINQKNAGVSAARNRGIEEAKGDLLAFLDADDEWQINYLQTQYDMVQKFPDCSVFATSYEMESDNGTIIPIVLKNIHFLDRCGILTNYFEVAASSNPPLWTSATMVRKSALLSIGGFPVGVKSGEDLLTWACLAVKYKIAYSLAVCATYKLDSSYRLSNLPPRKQDQGDPVGRKLHFLYKNNRTLEGFRRYLSHWHKMRASVAIRYGEKLETLKEVMLALKYDVFNFKAFSFALLVFMPTSLRKCLISNYRK